ncbi:MAG: AAA family ATPase [Candidatus Cloacimonadota bacterium]|nr:MAG: AAA family ATPase [Candidatus Cloacimonadota bacterium]PIE81369.1 MAG: AAA family ATPase [Candidatus Delongbacteria bacterium]
MKKLGLGTQELSMLRKRNCVYVDKTEYIYELINNETYCFLSRPRRFGKSLLLNTIKEIFQGNKELFKDTWIEDKYNFAETFPIIKICMASLDYANRGLDIVLRENLEDIAKNHKVKLETITVKEKFQELIIKLSKKNPVAILIDEYDKPIIDYIDEKSRDTAEKNRQIMKNFYSVLKNLDAHIRFLFITGVSKFSRVSIFSELNNLTDITINRKYVNITGYTEEEIIDNYENYLIELEEEYNWDRKRLLERIKFWYNGYSWDAKNFVYNPYSVLNLFNSLEFENFWFKSGTPTFLTKLIKEKDIDVKEYDNQINISRSVLDSYEISNIDTSVLLFQTGYLTIKEYIRDEEFVSFQMGYPNMEVRSSLYLFLGAEFAGLHNLKYSDTVNRLMIALKKNKIEDFIKSIRVLFADISNNLASNQKESYYHTVLYLALKFIGVQIDVEVNTNHGRIDAVVKTKDYIYIMEFKMSNAKAALKQIKEKKYYERYLDDERDIICLGVAFDSDDRNVKGYEVASVEEMELL